MKIYKNILKPFLDFTLALIGLIVIFPLFFSILIAQLIIYKGKPFFIQERPGKGEKIFKIIKFKSMTDCRDSNGKLLPEAMRLTKTGDFIRKYSLDEIPQLINVIRGDMSLIGPRPLLIRYLPLYNDFQKQRHHVKPGISGWAQINGRNFIDWEQKFIYDVWYVKKQSFTLDLKILVLTVIKILKPEGIYSQEDNFVADFTGTQNTNHNSINREAF